MRVDGTKQPKMLGLDRIPCVSEFTIPDRAGKCPDPAFNYIDALCSKLNEACRSSDVSYLDISSIWFPCSWFIPLPYTPLDHHHKNTKLCHPSVSPHAIIMWWQWVHYTQSTVYTEYIFYRVQHTPSTAYTLYSIHLVQHTPGTAYNEYSIPRLQYPLKNIFIPFSLMITSWPLNVASASGMPIYKIDWHRPAFHGSQMTLSPSHIPTVASLRIDQSSLSTRYTVHQPPSTTNTMSLDHGL